MEVGVGVVMACWERRFRGERRVAVSGGFGRAVTTIRQETERSKEHHRTYNTDTIPGTSVAVAHLRTPTTVGERGIKS